jgi:putative transposase
VAEGNNQPGPWKNLKNQISRGSDASVTSLQRTFHAEAQLREIPADQRRLLPKPLAQIAEEHEREEAIIRTYASGRFRL